MALTLLHASGTRTVAVNTVQRVWTFSIIGKLVLSWTKLRVLLGMKWFSIWVSKAVEYIYELNMSRFVWRRVRLWRGTRYGQNIRQYPATQHSSLICSLCRSICEWSISAPYCQQVSFPFQMTYLEYLP